MNDESGGTSGTGARIDFGLSVDLNGFFTLHRKDDGTVVADFGPKTQPYVLATIWKSTPTESGLVMALLSLAVFEIELPEVPSPVIAPPVGVKNAFEIHSAATKIRNASDLAINWIIEPLRKALGEDIKTLGDRGVSEIDRSAAKKRLIKSFRVALEIVENKELRQAHASASEFMDLDGDGRPVSLEWLILRSARELAESQQVLPRKREIRKHVVESFPETEDVSEGKWSNSFKNAGLGELLRASDW